MRHRTALLYNVGCFNWQQGRYVCAYEAALESYNIYQEHLQSDGRDLWPRMASVSVEGRINREMSWIILASFLSWVFRQVFSNRSSRNNESLGTSCSDSKRHRQRLLLASVIPKSDLSILGHPPFRRCLLARLRPHLRRAKGMGCGYPSRYRLLKDVNIELDDHLTLSFRAFCKATGVNVGGDTSAGASSDSTTKWHLKKLDFEGFLPSLTYVKDALKSGDVPSKTQWWKLRRRLYMVTGLRIERGSSIER